MQPHQQRVVDEKSELDDRIGKLRTFIVESPIFVKLDSAEQNRLNRQYSHMRAYSDILGERIAAFAPA
jgi:CRISPR/Cas system endoribonuclease Cas6 (RAMP superfamily)